ncbi:MAG: thiamine diphosphokinase [Ardenticatenales bacterium]|nr:thiamine diphosphokinase [Ardenticatenales bacterium]
MNTHPFRVPRAVLFANGDLPRPDIARALLRPTDLIVAANGGSRHCHRFGIVPTLLVGDADSLPRDVKAWLVANEVPQRRFDADKEATDLELAVDAAQEMGVGELLLLGLAGGRVDHMLANFALLAQAPQRNLAMTAVVGRQRIIPIWTSQRVVGRVGDTLSLIPWGSDIQGVHTKGLRWNLRGESLFFAGSRGVSNRLTEESAEISLKSGLLLVIHEFTAPVLE